MQRNFSLNETLERVAHLLPAQGPLKDFIHHNTLHAFQHEPFEIAVEKAALLYNAHAYMPLAFYREAYRDNKIDPKILLTVCEKSQLAQNNVALDFMLCALKDFKDTKDLHAWAVYCKQLGVRESDATKLSEAIYKSAAPSGLDREGCAYPGFASSPGASLAHRFAVKNTEEGKIRTILQHNADIDIDSQVNPTLFRLTAGYLDQGISLWQFPHTELGFFENVGKLAYESFFSIAPFASKSSFKKWFTLSAHETVLAILGKLLADESLYEPYITETLMAHAGWSGMVHEIAKKPSSLLLPRAITVVDFLAIKLVLEWELIQAQCANFKALDLSDVNKHFSHPHIDDMHARSLALLVLSAEKRFHTLEPSFLCQLTQQTLQKIWHMAFEESYYQSVLSSLKAHQSKPLSHRSYVSPTYDVQAVFCIDDRECSLRRYLEEADERIETYSTAGFFGLDFYFQSLNDTIPVKLCPAPVLPKHIVKEVPLPGHVHEFEKQRDEKIKTAIALQRWRETAGSLLFGFLAANTLGHLSLLRLFACLFKPKKFFQTLRTKTISVPSQISFWHKDTVIDANSSLQHGYTVEEMAHRVENVFRGIGLTSNFAPIVTFIAHGSSSANNPHFAAYDCGACSGRPGAPNARTFAMMANDADVRKVLEQRGFSIPESTRVIGGFHDTCTDVFEFFDVDPLTPAQYKAHKDFLVTLEKARQLNAKERCRRFESVELTITPQEALREAAHRASSLFEPRPELNHATNAACIVGRRALTKGLFLDRRAFLNSYDPLNDSQGTILNQILSAVVPVCGGINLEYYFSRIDSNVHGCGTKLSHNVCSLIGVYNGMDDDLRTGLPVQMTEMHDPIKLLVVVEQNFHLVSSILIKNAAVNEWIENGWVRLVCIDPHTKEFHSYIPDHGFKEHSLPTVPNKNTYSYAAWAQTSRDNLAIAELVTHG